MKRNHQIFETDCIGYQELIQQIAYHEAGHAAGIYLYNKENQLPPVFFQIMLNEPDFAKNTPLSIGSLNPVPFVAEVEGGRLIHELPVDVLESAQYFSGMEDDVYLKAFEADIINLLIGSLAEAKHAALRDDGYFNEPSVNIRTLHRYGGASDLEEIYGYLDGTIACKRRREEKFAELFNKALRFIAEPVHWRAIERLAGYILTQKENTIFCENVIALLDEAISPDNRIDQDSRSMLLA